jgi:hypothetical protein
MPQSPSVTVFNANTLSIQVSVNNGPQFSVAGASAPGWTPQTQASDGPGWSYNNPGQNTLAPGDNVLTITPAGSAQPSVATVTLPRTLQWGSVQLYIFFNGYGDVSWMALNNGQFVTGNMGFS